MNTLKSFIFIFSLILMVGCSSDDDGGGSIAASLVGTWSATDIEIEGNAQTDIQGQEFNAPIETLVTNNNFTVVFEENPNTFTSSGSVDIAGTVFFLGMEFEQNLNSFNPIGTGTYTLTGNQLVLSGSSDLPTVTIRNLTESSLVLDIENIVEFEEDGQPITATFNSNVEFVRQ